MGSIHAMRRIKALNCENSVHGVKKIGKKSRKELHVLVDFERGQSLQLFRDFMQRFLFHAADVFQNEIPATHFTKQTAVMKKQPGFLSLQAVVGP